MGRRDLAFSLVQDLLAAPGSQQGWQSFLLHLCEALDGTAGSFISHNLASSQGSISITARTAPEAFEVYQRHWHQFDPWAHSPALAGMARGTVVDGEQLVTRRNMRRSAYYNDFGRRYEIVDCLAGIIDLSPDTIAVLSINRGDHQPPFGDQESALLRTLMPPLQRALEVHRRIVGAELMAANAMDVLDRLPHGVFLVSSVGMLVSTNRAADEILAARDGLRVDRGELRASTVALTQQLRSAMQAAVHAAQGLGIDCGAPALALPRPSGRRPLSVVIAGLPVSRDVFTVNRATAAMFVSDPERSQPPDAGALRAMFALTPSEAELVRLLVSGLSLEESAARLGVRLDTVRQRLKAVFDKTDTHRQAELVRLILTAFLPSANP